MIVDRAFKALKQLRVLKLVTDQTNEVRRGVDRREVSDVAEQLRNLAKRLHASGATLLAQRAAALASSADQEVRRRELSPWLK